MAELHKFQLDSTMDSKTKLAEFLTPCQKLCIWDFFFFCIRLAMQFSLCSTGNEKEILHTSAVDLDARVEDTNPQGGGVFIYPVLQ